MKRKIISIDGEKCNGCGLCVPNCPEGALQVIDGKARLVGDLFCDGLGACLGECPLGAITIEKRIAEPYDETRVMENIILQGDKVIGALLKHLQDHNETTFYNTAVAILQKKGIAVPNAGQVDHGFRHAGCPGSRTLTLTGKPAGETPAAEISRLSTWPVQLHLLPPRAPYFHDRHLVLSADCVAYAAGGFHSRFLKDNVLAIACPKLDEGQEIYLDKLRTIIDEGMIRSLTVLTMEVPCCAGLIRLAERALAGAQRRDLPVVWQVIDLKGDIKSETKIN